MPDTDGRLGERGPLTDSGLAYCVAHHGVVDCDGGDGPCDFVDDRDPDQKCPACKGIGAVIGENEEPEDCGGCDGQGLTPCVLRPLLYEAEVAS